MKLPHCAGLQDHASDGVPDRVQVLGTLKNLKMSVIHRRTNVRTQVLRDEIGTAMTNKNSRADQFFLIIHGQEGEGEAKEAFLGKEGAQVCVTHRCVTV